MVFEAPTFIKTSQGARKVTRRKTITVASSFTDAGSFALASWAGRAIYA
jgi:hypothetical protein